MPKFMSIMLEVIIMAVLVSTCAAAGPTLSVNKTANSPDMDGKVADEVWQSAASIGSFTRFGKADIETDPTNLYITYDDANLYVGARCYQADKPVAQTRTRDAGMWLDDCVEIFLQPDVNSQTYYQFISNAVGNKYDGKGRDSSWDGEWNVKTGEGEGYWEIEFAIPWATIGVDKPADVEAIGANFCRNHPFGKSKFAGPSNIPGVVSSTWGMIRGSSYHDPSAFGLLVLRDSAPFARVNELAADPNAGLILDAQIVNPSNKDTNVKAYFEGVMEESVVSDEQIIDVPAGETRPVQMQLPLKPGSYSGTYVLTETSTGTTLAAQVFYAQIGRPLSVKAYWFADKITALLDAKNFTAFAPESGAFKVTSTNGSAQEFAASNVDGVWQADIDTKGLSAGTFMLTGYLLGGGQSAQVDEVEVVKPEEPEWLDCDLGLEDEVLPPWTPLKYADNTVECWGREYKFEDGLFASAITTQNRQLLAGPISIYAQVDGKEVSLQSKSAELESAGDTRVVLSRSAAGGGIEAVTKSGIEYDGLVRFDTTINGTGAQNIDRLYMDIPIKKEFAVLFDADPTDPISIGTFPYWQGGAGGKLPEHPLSGNFTPHVWIGDDNVGLTWVAESQKQWANSDQSRAIEIIPQEDRVVLRINYIDYPISADETLVYTCAIQATPVKEFAPYEKFGMYSFYGAQTKRIPADNPGDAMLTYPAAGNIDINKGSVHLRIAPEFDCSNAIYERTARDPRGDTDFALFSVDFPNSERFGLYFGVTDVVFRALAVTGQNRQKKEQTPATWRAPDWKRGEVRNITLSWGDGKVSIWSDGNKVSEADYNPAALTQPVSTARIRLGGSFTYDAVKISSSSYGGGEISFDNIEDNTVFLDKLELYNNTAKTFTPEHAALGTVGAVTGEFDISEGKLTLTADKRVDSLLDLWAASGISLMHLHETWTEAQGYPKTNEHAEEFKLLCDASNDLGVRVLPYLGFQLGDNTPEYADYKEEIVVEPFVEERGWNRGDHLGQDICYADRYQNFMIYSIDKLLSDYNIGGVYLDGTSIAPRCKNLAHGCGYYDRDGNLQPSYPIFEYRKFFKRMKAVGLKYRKDFWMDIHTTIGICTPVTGFGDSIWKGEQYTFLVGQKGTIEDLLETDGIRAGMGRQYGIPVYFLNYDQIEECAAVCAVMDMPLRLDGGLRNKVRNYYSLHSAKWHPYWENEDRITATDPKTLVSYWKREDGAVVLAVSNLMKDKTPIVEEIALDTDEIGLTSDAIASDAISGELLEYTDGKLKLPITPWRYRLVLISPANVQSPRVPGDIWPHIGK